MQVEKKDTNSSASNEMNPLIPLTCGAFGGACSVIAGHPFDTLKVRMQTMQSPLLWDKPMYRNTWDCYKKTIQYEGYKSLYKGMSVSLMSVPPVYATCFSGYTLGRVLQQSKQQQQNSLNYSQIAVAGMLSGFFTSMVSAPSERVKCLLQNDKEMGRNRKYCGVKDCITRICKDNGVRGLFKGTGVTMLRDIPGYGVFFVSYEYIQGVLANVTGLPNLNMLTATLAGGLAGMAYWTISMPADVIKSRMQTASKESYPLGIRRAYRDLMKSDGISGLYKGVTPVMLRTFPVNAACLFGISLANDFFHSVIS